MSFRENWFREQKNASLNGNVSFGVNLRVQKWFGWFLNEGDGRKEEEKEGVPNLPTSAPSNQESPTLPTDSGSETAPAPTPITDDLSAQLRENNIDETQIQELEENRGDWIERDKSELSSVGAKTGDSGTQAGTVSEVKDGILHRILKSFTVNTTQTSPLLNRIGNLHLAYQC